MDEVLNERIARLATDRTLRNTSDHFPDGLRQKLLLIAICAYETKKQKAALSHDGRPLKG